MTIATISTIITCLSIIPFPLESVWRSSRPIPQPLDLALEAAFLLDGDPLDHLQPLLELPDLVAQPRRLAILFGDDVAVAAALAAAADGGAQHAADHHDQHDEGDDLIRVHRPVSSPRLLNSRGRRAAA